MDADSLTMQRRKSSNKPYHIHSFQVQIFRIGAQKLFTSQNIVYNLLSTLKSARFRPLLLLRGHKTKTTSETLKKLEKKSAGKKVNFEPQLHQKMRIFSDL